MVTYNKKKIYFYNSEPFSSKSRRIVDMFYVFNQIQKSNKHTPGLGCTFIDMNFVKEECKGLSSSWYFKCKMCNCIMIIDSERVTPDYLPINKSAVNGTIAVGIGHTQLAELFASLDIPCMTSKTYTKYINNLSENIKATAWDVIKLAGVEEKQLAIEAGDIDEDGTPMCPVIADGQWSKRSYKTKYDAYSGAVS